MRRIVCNLVPAALVFGFLVTGPAHAGTSKWRLQVRARDAADIGEFDRAHKLYSKARRLDPEDGYLAYAHAKALAAAGRTEEALAALDTALTHGFRHDKKMIRSEELVPLRDAPNWDELLERARANLTDFKARLGEAREPIDPADAPAFANIEELLADKEKSDGEYYGQPSDGDPQVRRARYVERWAGAMLRLADEKNEKETIEREQALLALLRLRVDEAIGLDLHWPQHAIDKVAAAAERYLAEYADTENVTEARLARSVAGTVAPYPDDFDLPRSSWPQPHCTQSLPDFEQLSATDPADSWSLTALGFKALCLAKVSPDRHDEIHEAAASYLGEDEIETTYDVMLRAGLKIAMWRLDGLPEFEAEALEGGTLSVADFKGKVTLLDFWNPG